jgi:predicted DsbA family dithiol-disulfide isomerase
VRLAQHMAVASERVRAVPKVVINERVEFEGALPEPEFLGAVLRAAGAHGR